MRGGWLLLLPGLALAACTTRTFVLDDRLDRKTDARAQDAQVVDSAIARSDAALDSAIPVTTTHRLPTGIVAGEVTYHQYAKPILEARCVPCHRSDGYGPFALDTYAQARALRETLHDAVASEQMPPFPPARAGCRKLLDARDMSEGERAVLEAWVLNGALEGASAEPSVFDVEAVPGLLGAASATFPLAASYRAPASDLPVHRCFVVDPKLTGDSSLLAIGVLPDNARALRHALVHLALPGSELELAALEAGDAQAGYDCYYGGGFSGAITVSDWVVGQSRFAFPDATAITVPAGSRFVLELDEDPARGSDTPALALWQADAVVQRAPSTLYAINTSFVIPRNAESFSAVATGKFTTRSATPGSGEARQGTLWGVSAHMHLRGQSARIELAHQDGSRECLLDLPSFDTRWEGGYRFAEPLHASAGDQLVVTCRWNNSAANQPVVDGQALPSRDLRLGTSVLDETCVGSVLLTED